MPTPYFFYYHLLYEIIVMEKNSGGFESHKSQKNNCEKEQ